MLTSMMRAWTLLDHGDPDKVLAIQERPVPIPDAGQVLIRVEGFGLNYADVMAVKDLYREAPPLPSILGYEVVGLVEKVGAGAPMALVGKRVVAMTRFGGYAEYALTDHRALAEVPLDAPLGEVAALATQGCTAWYAARVLCPLRKGERVLVHSAAGGVGQLLVQLALQSGCIVFALASGHEKVEYLRGLGVQYPIDRSSENYERAIDRLLGKERLDVSFNAVGGSTYPKDMRLVGSGGRIVLYGGSERGRLKPFGSLRFVWRMGIQLPILLMMKSRSVLGINMLRIAEHKPSLLAECLSEVATAYAKGHLLPRVHAEFAAKELPKAMAALDRGGTIGKVVVRW
ncbi:MAG: zinc-binding dehydrogenase [Flavobacteriales bacterium]|nr:zinc-binding dehydrogenase [Flavobacteriales bacterium]